jgi:hypothetical protein
MIFQTKKIETKISSEKKCKRRLEYCDQINHHSEQNNNSNFIKIKMFSLQGHFSSVTNRINIRSK